MGLQNRFAVGGVVLALVLGGAACSDDGSEVDEIEEEIDNADLDPGEGDGLPGDSSDEGNGADDDVDAPDLDPGAGEGLPGDSQDEG